MLVLAFICHNNRDKESPLADIRQNFQKLLLYARSEFSTCRLYMLVQGMEMLQLLLKFAKN